MDLTPVRLQHFLQVHDDASIPVAGSDAESQPAGGRRAAAGSNVADVAKPWAESHAKLCVLIDELEKLQVVLDAARNKLCSSTIDASCPGGVWAVEQTCHVVRCIKANAAQGLSILEHLQETRQQVGIVALVRECLPM